MGVGRVCATEDACLLPWGPPGRIDRRLSLAPRRPWEPTVYHAQELLALGRVSQTARDKR
jgi:hypothetical protein